ncbi:MAG: uroporphyrinogen decarboxylase family protein [Planctomycetota bacterium]
MARTKFPSKILIMNHVERFRAVMGFKPVDRLPRWEWAMWWDKTIERWHREGLPSDLKFNNVFDISQYFSLDPYMQFWFSTTEATIEATQHHVEGMVANMDDYLKVKPRLYPDHSEAIESMRPWADKQKKGQAVVWATLEGFFWFPRTLMDIGKLSYAFYDQPELVHAINKDLLEFNLGLVRQMERTCVPTFMTFAEDVSYNHGPMISRKAFDEFLAPYYKKLIPLLKELDIIPIVDTDGDVTELVPWLEEVGIKGVLPLERQAGVDGILLRQKFPKLRMIGHFNKMVMNQGQQAIRSEFERLRPLMRTGGFIPSVDHQTPPGVSLEEYHCYLQLLQEYTVLAVKE